MRAGFLTGVRLFRLAAALLFVVYNLMPLYGLWAWHWDAFQLLIMYWTETLILAAWTLVRIDLVPVQFLGVITVNGRPVKATHGKLIAFFTVHAGMFMAVHLFFLCVLFSDGWFRRLHGLGDFLSTFYVISGAWIPLSFAALGSGIEALTGTFRPQFVYAIERRLFPDESFVPQAPPVSKDMVGQIVFALYGRIIMMQIAIIGGAWLARDWNSLGPILILIGLKTLFDFGSRVH
jgi:Family of unknown function (DUF6498)